MTWTRVRRVFCLLLVIVIMYGTYSLIAESLGGAQEQSNAEKKGEGSLEGRSFNSLRDERETLEKELRGIEKEVNALLDQLTGSARKQHWRSS